MLVHNEHILFNMHGMNIKVKRTYTVQEGADCVRFKVNMSEHSNNCALKEKFIV